VGREGLGKPLCVEFKPSRDRNPFIISGNMIGVLELLAPRFMFIKIEVVHKFVTTVAAWNH
jgi:hypothetical protein